MTRRAGLGLTTVRPDFDFETYSEAGFVWNADRQKWESPAGAAAGKKGLPVVGAAVYAQHGLPLLFRITPFTHPGALDAELGARGYAAYDPWPVFVVLKAMTQYAEVTDDPRVLPVPGQAG